MPDTTSSSRSSGTVLVASARRDIGRSYTWTGYHLEHPLLVTRGVYARVRHPIYQGIWLFMAGGTLTVFGRVSLAAHVVAGLALVYIGAFLTVAASRETRYLAAVIGEDSTKIIVVLLVAKFLAYGVSLGCGFRGGPIFPAIFLGIALASLTVVWFDVSPTLAVSVSTAAGMAAQTRLIVTPVLLSTLLVGSQGLDTVPAAVLATASAWLAMALVDQRNERATVATPPTPA